VVPDAHSIKLTRQVVGFAVRRAFLVPFNQVWMNILVEIIQFILIALNISVNWLNQAPAGKEALSLGRDLDEVKNLPSGYLRRYSIKKCRPVVGRNTPGTQLYI